jgi:hypothetical protein
MPSQLDNLVTTGKLKREAPAQDELDSRFDLAYNAAHAFALAALRHRGYRSESRYLVFQVLVHTVGLANADWRVLDDAHRKRNRSEYEGLTDIDQALVDAIVRVAREIEKRVRALGPVAGE